MINFATVHWNDDAWVDVQLRYIERHTDEEHQVWAFLGRFRRRFERHAPKFAYASDLPIRSHEWKLNLLGDLICAGGRDPGELLVFIDGDAFPIAPLVPYLREHLARFPLLAVRRDENNGDRQPHPSFCATTVGFWREIRGDWRRGPTWRNAQGEEVTDVGARLLEILDERGIAWHPMLRSNRRDLHPLLFGVYDDVAYHHGGGFRDVSGGRVWRAQKVDELNAKPLARLLDRLPERDPFDRLRRRWHPRRRYHEALAERVGEVSAEVFELIERDDDFARLFLDPDYDGPLADVRAPLLLD
jgi:hypothetical protein